MDRWVATEGSTVELGRSTGQTMGRPIEIEGSMGREEIDRLR